MKPMMLSVSILLLSNVECSDFGVSSTNADAVSSTGLANMTAGKLASGKGTTATPGGGRIIGGRPALQGEFPWMVSLQFADNFQHFCGGSLITKLHVLTASHCVILKDNVVTHPSKISLYVGSVELYGFNIHGQRVLPRAIFTHPAYRSVYGLVWDLAIIKASRAFKLYPEYVEILPLPRISKEDILRITNARWPCVAMGWGTTETQPLSNILLKVNLQLIPMEEAEYVFKELGKGLVFRKKVHLAAVGYKKDTCTGDSGGPLVVLYNNEKILAGVVSFGVDVDENGTTCATSIPGVYARVDTAKKWLKKALLRDSAENSPPNTILMMIFLLLFQ